MSLQSLSTRLDRLAMVFKNVLHMNVDSLTGLSWVDVCKPVAGLNVFVIQI